MNDLNQFAACGTVVADPDHRPAGQGTVTKFRIAISRDKKTPTGWERAEGVFIDVECWDWLARQAFERLKKGTKVFVAGPLAMDSWTDKETGQKRSKLYVKGDKFEVIELPNRGAERTSSNYASADDHGPRGGAADIPF